MEIKATIKGGNYQFQGRFIEKKRGGLHEEFSAIETKTGKSFVTLRIYYTGRTCHALLWANSGRIFHNGYGRAGGYGYDKPSAAAQAAISAAGIELSADINGRGQDAIIAAVRAIAEAIYGGNIIVHHAHA